MKLEQCEEKIGDWINSTNFTYKYFDIDDLQIDSLSSPKSTEFLNNFGHLKRKLLLHASPIANRVKIETEGLVKLSETRNRGATNSLGIHFYDMAQDVFHYARPCANDNQVLLYICDVAIGEPLVSQKQQRHNFSSDQLGETHNSFFIKGCVGPVENETLDWELNGASACYKKIVECWDGYEQGNYSKSQIYNEYVVVNPEQIDLKFRVVLKVKPTFRHGKVPGCGCFDYLDLDLIELISKTKSRFG